MQAENGWSEYKRTILRQLEDLERENDKLREELTRTKIEVAMLNVKAGVFGLVGGLLPFGLFIAYQILGNRGG